MRLNENIGKRAGQPSGCSCEAKMRCGEEMPGRQFNTMQGVTTTMQAPAQPPIWGPPPPLPLVGMPPPLPPAHVKPLPGLLTLPNEYH